LVNFIAELVGTSEAWAMAPEELPEPVEPPDAPSDVAPPPPEEVVLPPLLLSPPPQAATTEAPAVVTPIAAPSRMNFLREIPSSKTSSWILLNHLQFSTFLYT
jgi:hypothetical protein